MAAERKMTSPKILISGMGLALVIALFLSPWASSFPDGLERVAKDLGFIKKAEKPGVTVWEKSPIPDYKIPGIQNESLATGLAGLAGTAAIAAAGWGLARLLRKRDNR
jgi:cobalt/nickel transport protein